MFPRELSIREFEWLTWLLPVARPGYHRIMERVRPLFVIGEGRWGKNDFVLGPIGGEIDRTAGMLPVIAFGQIHATSCTVTVALHAPNDDGQFEFQISTSSNSDVPEIFDGQARWTYSTWSPGDPCPATGAPVREVPLPANNRTGLCLAISPRQRVIWLHDPVDLTNMLVPVTNFYNELMLEKRIRDPNIALNHGQLFANGDQFSDSDLVAAFIRYNVLYHKVGVELFDAPAPNAGSFWSSLFKKRTR